MKIATYNINGIKARLPQLSTGWSRPRRTSSCSRRRNALTRAFPGEAIEALGYNVATHGQKASTGWLCSPSCRSRT
jgi:exodeoxyribonuclease III